MRLAATLDLDPDMAAAFAAAVSSGEHGSTQEAVLMAALTMLLEHDGGLKAIK